MKKFVFRLRRLLDIRTQEKRAFAAAMARLQTQIMNLDAAIDDAEHEWRSWRERCMQEKSAAALDRLGMAAYLESVEQRAAALHDDKGKLIRDLETMRRSFERAARGERTLENLRAKKLEEYVHVLNRAEQTIADELAMQKDWQRSASSLVESTQTAGKDS